MALAKESWFAVPLQGNYVPATARFHTHADKVKQFDMRFAKRGYRFLLIRRFATSYLIGYGAKKEGGRVFGDPGFFQY